MIITFSGTGNSFMVAELLGNELHDKNIIKLQGSVLNEGRLGQISTITDNCIIWVFPTYSWGIPPIVRTFIKQFNVTMAPRCVHHLVVTCGDDVGSLVEQWNKLLKEKGWKAGGAWSVQMPNTYVLMKGFNVDTLEVEEDKLRRCPQRVAHIASRIKNGNSEVDVVKGRFAKFKTAVIYPWFVKFDMSPRPFHANDRCISCGLCAQDCPTLNIEMEPVNDPAARPKWNNRCALCLRCYHRCPAHAIQYGKATINKGQYNINKVLAKIDQ